MDLGNIDFCRAMKRPVLRNLDDTRVHGGLHRALNHQRVAIRDLHAFELDIGAHSQLAAARLLRIGQRRLHAAHGGAAALQRCIAAQTTAGQAITRAGRA